MSYLKKIEAGQLDKEALKQSDNLATVIRNMIKDTRFEEALHDMIDASLAAIHFAKLSKNDAMLKFNTLCLALFHAVMDKDEDAAIDAARLLVKSGHGKAFGLA